MKKTNWHWDIDLPPEKIEEILANEHDPSFVSIAARLMARSRDAEEVFSFISPMSFCRRFYAIQKDIVKDEWSKEKAAFWRATYQRYLKEFKAAGVRIREKTPREIDAFTRNILERMGVCRKQAHLSQKELAVRIGYSQQFVSGIESGREKLTLSYLRKFAQATGSRFDAILYPPGQMESGEKKVEDEYAELTRWSEAERGRSLQTLGADRRERALMEILAYCPDRVLNSRRDRWQAEKVADATTMGFRQDQLLDAMEKSQVHSFGWPIGVVMDREEYKPKAVRDGIRASILIRDESYDYWALRNDLVFYLLKTLFEDARAQGKIFLDTRIVRTAEAILRISRLYKEMGIPSGERVVIRIRYAGLRGRELSAADRGRASSLHGGRICIEDEAEINIHERLGSLQPKLVELTHRAVSNLTMLFNYFQPSQEQIVRPLLKEFFKGEVEIQGSDLGVK